MSFFYNCKILHPLFIQEHLNKVLFEQFLQRLLVDFLGIVGYKLFRRHAEELMKTIAEVRMRGETDSICHLRDVDLVVDQQVSGLFEAESLDIDTGRHTIPFLHLSVEVHAAQAYFVGECHHAVLGIVEKWLERLVAVRGSYGGCRWSEYVSLIDDGP